MKNLTGAPKFCEFRDPIPKLWDNPQLDGPRCGEEEKRKFNLIRNFHLFKINSYCLPGPEGTPPAHFTVRPLVDTNGHDPVFPL
uniref:Uncharacterized protein n=1 Tax=Romanomermis culicivorax TaxID=13658 RepID=A0A915I399_ROMCU